MRWRVAVGAQVPAVLTALAAVLTVGCTSAPGLADSPWPKYQGDQFNTGQSKYVGSQTGRLKWTFRGEYGAGTVPAIGRSGTLYVGGGNGEVFALNPRDGGVKWVSPHMISSSASAMPAIGRDGTIYVAPGDCSVYALNPRNGRRKWMFNTKGGVDSSPAIGVDGRIYFGSGDKKVYAIDPESGMLRWTRDTFGYVTSSPAIGADGTVYVGSHDCSLYALNPADGSVKWSRETGGIVDASPAIAADGTVYVTSRDGNVYAIAPSDGSVKWKCKLGSEKTRAVSLLERDEPEGSLPVWDGFVLSSAAVARDGTVYVGSDVLSAIAPADGKVKWTFSPGGRGEFERPFVGTPSIGADGTVYVGWQNILYLSVETVGGIFALDPSGGAVKWSYDVVKGVVSPPTIGGDGTVYALGDSRTLYAFGR